MKKKFLRMKHPSNQASLLGKTFGVINKEEKLKEDVDNLKLELERIHHVLTCETCMVEAVLSIERYLGRNLPWYLDLVNGWELPGDPVAPSPNKYEIGCYGNSNFDETSRFIKDRLAWAQNFIEDTLQDVERSLEEVERKRFF